MSNSSTRVNLALPIDAAILIEKECDKRGTRVPQFIKEAINEKLKRIEGKEEHNDLNQIKNEILEIKKLLLVLLDLTSKKSH